MNTITKMLPSGLSVTIREQNGQDEGILSRLGDTEDGVSYNKFLSEIITGTSKKENARMTPEEIALWPTINKYYLLIESRIFSLGNEIKSKFKCSKEKCGHETPIVVDLTKYTWDLTKGSPMADEPDYSHKPKLLENGEKTEFEAKMSTGRKIKFTLLTTMGELKTFRKDRDELNKNDELTARNLAYQTEAGEWITITSFKMFSSREMSEIRKIVFSYDMEYDLSHKCKCAKCNNVEYVNILALPDFFFPSEI